jgi:hypothetical protein
MRTRDLAPGAVALGLLVAAVAVVAGAQGTALDRRVAAVADGTVELHFAARADACGDGAHWYRVGADSWYGSMVNSDDAITRATCAEGPVRVRLTVAAREIVRIASFVGPLRAGEGVTDLGEIPAAEASAWLLTLAARLDGRPARDAITPATLARTDAPGAALQALARSEERSHDTRRAALGALLRLEGNAGVPSLVALTERPDDVWLAREALRVVARSGDPRARAHLRAVAQDVRRGEALRSIAIGGLGNDLATATDGAVLRATYRSFETERGRSAVLSAVAGVGGKANAEWLVAIARNADESPALRRRAVQALERIDSPDALSGLITLATPDDS